MMLVLSKEKLLKQLEDYTIKRRYQEQLLPKTKRKATISEAVHLLLLLTAHREAVHRPLS